MSRYRFSYLTLRGKHHPLIPIKLYYEDSAVRTYALVDSGSTLSVFRAEIADSLELKLEDGEKVALQSANAPLMVYAHRLRAEVERILRASSRFHERPLNELQHPRQRRIL